MTLLFRLLHGQKCKNTHHKLALDALPRLGVAEAGAWADVFLWHVEPYFRGAKAPDDEFKDFANHVLHVRPVWGGAARLAAKWYGTTVERLRTGDWAEAAFAAGVLGHYVTDPLMPLHTGQTPAEATIHRAIEWAAYLNYDALTADPPAAEPPVLGTGGDWLERLLAAEAERSHRHYDALIASYDLTPKRLPTDLSEPARAVFREQLLRSAATLGAVLGRAIAESAAAPPHYPTTAAAVLAVPALPLFAVSKAVARRRGRSAAAATHREFQKTGKVEKTLPVDVRGVVEAYEREVLGGPRPAEPPKTAPEQATAAAPLRNAPPAFAAPRPAAEPKRTEPKPAEPSRSESKVVDRKPAEPKAVEPKPAEAKPAEARPADAKRPDPPRPKVAAPPAPAKDIALAREAAPFGGRSTPAAGLKPSDPVEKAPSVGPKIAERLEEAGLPTVADLLAADPAKIAAAAGGSVTESDAADWQEQARLCCGVPGLHGYESQLLVACGVGGPDDLVQFSPVELWELVVPVAESPDGRRMLRGSKAPGINDVTRWIDSARGARAA